MSPDGKRVAWADDRGLPNIVDLAIKKTTSPFQGEQGCTSQLLFSPNGKILACELAQQDGSYLLKLWDLEKQHLHSLPAAFFSPSFIWPFFNRPVAFSKDSKTVAVRDFDCVRLYDLATDTERVRVKGHRAAVGKLHFSSDRRSLISSDEAVVCRWSRDAIVRSGFRPHPEIRLRAEVNKLLVENGLRGESGTDVSQNCRVHGEIHSLDLTRVLNQEGDILNFSSLPPQKICRLEAATRQYVLVGELCSRQSEGSVVSLRPRKAAAKCL